MIELYELAGTDPDHRFSPFCWRTRMALAHKGLEPRTVPWHFGEQSRLPGAPEQRSVPVIVDDGTVIGDSSQIALYLENEYGNGPSLFGGPAGEAHARFIVAWADTVLHLALFPIVAPDVVRFVAPAVRPEWQRAREARLGMTLEAARAARHEHLPGLRATLAPMRHALRAAPYLGGEEPSYADYAVFGAFQWARLTSDVALLEPEDALLRWQEQMLDMFDGLAREAHRP